MAFSTPLPVPDRAYGERDVQLNDEQKAQYEEALAHFSKEDFKIADLENGELMDAEKMWLSEECILRYAMCPLWHCERYLLTALKIFKGIKVDAVGCHQTTRGDAEMETRVRLLRRHTERRVCQT